tara:strand:- start:529 stop:747 length:219 start_codon:yes stop_codon:yes gene_type:complete
MSAFVTDLLILAKYGTITHYWSEYDIENYEEWACAIQYRFCNLSMELEAIEIEISENRDWFLGIDGLSLEWL